MYKQIFRNTTLQLVMQNQEVDYRPLSRSGVLSKDGEGFRFEEAVKVKRPRRNPKLYEGKYVSLVHRSDDKYACTLKCIRRKEKGFDHHDMAFRIYLELIDALQIIG